MFRMRNDVSGRYGIEEIVEQSKDGDLRLHWCREMMTGEISEMKGKERQIESCKGNLREHEGCYHAGALSCTRIWIHRGDFVCVSVLDS